MASHQNNTLIFTCTFLSPLPLPEQSLEVLRQFRSPGIPRVHGDEQTHTGQQFDLTALKQKPLLLGLDGILDALHLHSYHRQHLHRYPVELIKTSPCSSLRKAFVNVANRLGGEGRGGEGRRGEEMGGKTMYFISTVSRVFSIKCHWQAVLYAWYTAHDQATCQANSNKQMISL